MVLEAPDAIGEVRQHVTEFVDFAVCVEQSEGEGIIFLVFSQLDGATRKFSKITHF
jgi:hypothetical protein